MARGPYGRYGQTDNPAPNQTVRKHVMVGGEELPFVAAQEYGQGYDQELWRQIAEANAITDLDEIAAGDVIQIPQPSPSST